MLVRLIPPPPQPTILFTLLFPNVLPLESLGPGATVPTAWSSQLHLITSFLQLDPPSNIHMLDRAVGLVARTREVCMDVSQKDIVVRFVDGRVASIPMNSDCVRMLLAVALDVKGCSEPESQRSSMEGSASPRCTPGTPEDFPSGSVPTKSPKVGKHKRQRSLLFSLISSLIPKSLSSSAPSPPPTAPPPTPLPPLPTVGRMISPVPPRQPNSATTQLDPDFLRQRARATLTDVWRRHIITALSPQHLPAAGYAEWTLIAIASKVRGKIEAIKADKIQSRGVGIGISSKRTKHRQTKSEGRNALDFGERNDDYGSERCRAPSPFPGMSDLEDTDRVVYPRREHADEWGVRYGEHSRSFDEETDLFAVEFNGYNDNLAEHFMVGDDWDDNERLTFELGRVERHNIPSSSLFGTPPHVDFGLDYDDDANNKIADTTFEMARTPLVPCDMNDDEESIDSQVSLRTPEEGEELLVPPVYMLQGSTHFPQPPSVSRVSSSRARSRNASAELSNGSPMLGQESHIPAMSSWRVHDPGSIQIDGDLYSHYNYLERICDALEMVRGRAREEGWRVVRATMIGSTNGWIDDEMERTLEIKAKRRAWSSGIKIYAPYSPPTHSAPMVWDGSFSTFRSPVGLPDLPSSRMGVPRRGPIVPTGLSLGMPVRRSPLAMFSWRADGRPISTPVKYGILKSAQSMETIERRQSSRVTFANDVSKLFPVCEDDNEDSFDPIQISAVGFPQGVPTSEPEVVEGPADNEDDPFGSCPSQPRTRTMSMFGIAPSPSPPPSPVLPNTPPPSYQVFVGADISVVTDGQEGRLDASSLLLQPLSSLTISPPPHSPSPRPLLTPFVPRPRAVSLPSTRPCSRTSSHHNDERCQDLTRAYASPPPEGPLMISATLAPHEQYPRYAHVYASVPASKMSVNAPIPRRTGKEVVFEQSGSEFTVGIEVALGRAEEGRVIW